MAILTIEPTVGPESSAGQVFLVSLSEPVTRDVTATVRIVAQTADPSSDVDFNFYSAVTLVQEITIPAGDQLFELFVEQNADGAEEVDEAYLIEVTDPVNADLPGGVDVLRVTGVIQDDGRSLFVSDPVVLEGDSGDRDAVFEVRLSRPAPEALEFSYTTQDGSATAGVDYGGRSGTLSFLAGQETAIVRVPILGDTRVEDLERFSLVVTPTGDSGDLIFNGTSDNVGIGTIRDDDAEGPLPVVTIEPSVGPEASSGQVFAIRLSEATTRDVSMRVRIEGQTADPKSDVDFDFFSAVRLVDDITIAAGQTTYELFVEQNGDGTDEIDENYIIEVSDPVNAVLAGGEPVLRTTGVIVEDGRGLFVGDPVLLEADGGTKLAVFEVRLSQPAEEVLTFDYATIDGTAQAGEDYVGRSGTFSMAAGQTEARLAVEVNGDKDVETLETFFLRVSPQGDSASLIFNGVADNVGEAKIIDDDGPGVRPVLSAESTVGPESAAGQVFVLRLSKPSTQDVTVQARLIPETADSSDVDFDFFSAVRTTTEVVIPAGQTTYELFVEQNDTEAGETDETYVLELSDPTNALLAGGEDTYRTAGVILEEEQTGANGRNLFVSDPVIREIDGAGGEAVFEVRLSRPISEEVRLDYATFDGTAQAGTDYRERSGSLTFESGVTVQYVRVPLIGDNREESSETFSLSVTANPTTRLQFADFFSDNVGTAKIENDDSVIEGTRQGETLRGTSTDDLILGRGGNDRLIGFADGDTLRGQAGSDVLDGRQGADRLIGGRGSDTAFYGASRQGVDVDLADERQAGGHAQGDQLVSVENVVGSGAADLLRGNGKANMLDGRNGDDTIVGRGGDDSLGGGGGRDRLVGNGGDDRILGGAADDRLLGGGGADDIFGGGGRDRLVGGAGSDQLRGNGGRDDLDGGGGRDRLLGGAGNDDLTGGDGHDRLVGGGGRDRLEGGAGDDLLNGGGRADVFVFARGFGNDRIQDLGRGNDRIELDDALWQGDLSRSQVLNRFGEDLGDDVALDFGARGTVVIENVDEVEALLSMLVIV